MCRNLPAKALVFALLLAASPARAAAVTVTGGTLTAQWIGGSTVITLPAVGPGQTVASSFAGIDLAVEWSFTVAPDGDEFWGSVTARSAALAFARLDWDIITTETMAYRVDLYSVDHYDRVGFDGLYMSLRGYGYGPLEAGVHTWGMGWAQELSLHQGDVHAWVVPEPAAWAVGAGMVGLLGLTRPRSHRLTSKVYSPASDGR